MQNEFYCEIRGECLPLEVRCDGVLDCYSDEDLFETDESNCDGQWLFNAALSCVSLIISGYLMLHQAIIL